MPPHLYHLCMDIGNLRQATYEGNWSEVYKILDEAENVYGQWWINCTKPARQVRITEESIEDVEEAVLKEWRH
ncbi:Protein of unknown function [Pyronema omphalodes CBS 100304]|uniref:Uncharacterized protein n=1 Tax=Pyronema omphalodes (strain CBS 100304) TaxID=1076935 RepID=U4L1H2_PYROM|nr:Protein of unknown function [Pyronema omphalodes CBS 100304]